MEFFRSKAQILHYPTVGLKYMLKRITLLCHLEHTLQGQEVDYRVAQARIIFSSRSYKP